MRISDWSSDVCSSDLTLCVIPAQDRIVPPASATALADAIPGAERLTPAAGHIGMVVGARAEKAVWQPPLAWISERGAAAPKQGAAAHQSRVIGLSRGVACTLPAGVLKSEQRQSGEPRVGKEWVHTVRTWREP